MKEQAKKIEYKRISISIFFPHGQNQSSAMLSGKILFCSILEIPRSTFCLQLFTDWMLIVQFLIPLFFIINQSTRRVTPWPPLFTITHQWCEKKAIHVHFLCLLTMLFLGIVYSNKFQTLDHIVTNVVLQWRILNGIGCH